MITKHLARALGLAATVGLAWATPAQAQVPSGSYQGSCSGASVANNVLRAKCRTGSGSVVDTSLQLPCNGAINNINGQLQCQGAPAAGVPPGGYLQTCGDAKVANNVLSANCRRANQTIAAASLQLPCAGPIDNNNGVLTCAGVPKPPGGSAPAPTPTAGGPAPDFVKRFAPVLVFAGGSEGWGYPMSAQTFRDAMKNPATKYPVENKDKNSLANGSIPTYYQVRKFGNQTRIRYWFFYGYQHPCTGSQGSHNGDWENIVVVLTENGGNIAAVRFSQHDAFYTRISGPRDAPCTPGGIGRCGGSGGFERRGTQPVVYVGKAAHGSYHNTYGGLPGPGQCTYYGDARGGGPTMNTSMNLIDVDGKAEAWLDEGRNAGWAWGPDGISTNPPKDPPTHPMASCKGSPAYDFGAAASAYDNGPGCFYNECLSGDDQAAERCIKECKSGYSNVGLTCNKGKWPWEWSIYGRLDSGNWYHYGYTIPTGDAGLSRRRNSGGEWNLP